MEMKTRTESVINKFINKYQKSLSKYPDVNYFEYLYESDIQAELYMMLRKKFSKVEDTIRAKVKGVEYNFSPVKTEYPTRTRFDIAIINQQPITDIWKATPLIAIEIKYWQSYDNKQRRISEFEKDLKKLKNHGEVKYRLSIMFVQDESDWNEKIKYLEEKKIEILGERTDIQLSEKYVTAYMVGKKQIVECR